LWRERGDGDEGKGRTKGERERGRERGGYCELGIVKQERKGTVRQFSQTGA
jgi:hypothetical protein